MKRTIIKRVVPAASVFSVEAELLFEIQTVVGSKGPSHWFVYACAARLRDGQILCVYLDCGDCIAGIFFPSKTVHTLM
ncbi:MAG TPA: hypothetical protein PLQ35_06445 [bacterium]|nr:hypothetical protein [bacterium]HQL61915.1 hypothetical protein [bacterium]